MADSQQMFKAGECRGTAQAKTDEWIDSAKNTASTARDKTANAAQCTQESAQHGKEQTAGFLQQTGEQVMNMAHGAMDSMKNTLGVGDNNSHIYKK
ncbi:hypothetical protein HHK36_012960 [Tetracentron sinense]|uniref:Uncharacterized protein n=1 Tax=Tetracentron sinense TaxID=13715 RepID=A0A834Z5N8_TETSI|nr:hypothetical protein HHK36_012960 [Tetracentron sinense]